ncbi:uncharacterized protein LOC141693695 [Apium graveolens]|uniref:uncharacterized protein LOC141693695 n=1 Tax=Apium graveolens TaxID=4045 RepID=UPI003D793757
MMASNSELFGSNVPFQLTSHKLNGHNYLEWAQRMKLAIGGRGKLGLLNGETIKSAEGLNQDLDEVRGRILGRKSLPSLREVFYEVRREEMRRKVMINTTKSVFESPALVFKGAEPDGERRKKPWCDHCKRPWHTRETCWKIHGKPNNVRKKQFGDNRNSQANIADSSPQLSSGMQPFTKEQIEQICKILSSQNLD